jgi:diacylglycerol O-acyltransferase / wax synthase
MLQGSGLQQLTGVDASFLNLETNAAFGHVSSLNIFDPGDVPGAAGFEATKSLIAERIEQLAPFRRRLVEVPMGLDLPYWTDDPDFDLDYHVRHHAVPPPGTDEQLAEVVARIVARPLDRRRPLWELYVIEGLEGGRIAQLTKIHHATIDGASGAQMLGVLLDTDPSFRPSTDPDTLTAVPGARIPTDTELLQRTAVEYLRRPEKMVRLTVRTLRELGQSTGSGGLLALADLVAQPMPGTMGKEMRKRLRGRRITDRAPALPPTPAPRTPFNASITPHRRFAFTSMPLAQAKVVRQATGATFNDVVLAICAGALRRYLARHEALPDEPLIAMVPVSIRTGGEGDTYQNRVSGLLTNLATDIDDPLERLAEIRRSMISAKADFAAIPAETLQDFTQFAPPALAARAMRMYARTRIADRFNPPFNLIISNVPGPTEPLYSAGGKLLHFYPVSAVVDGQGLNITVQSYNGKLDFGLIAARDLVPDLWDLTEMIHDALDELVAAATAAATPPAGARKPAARKSAKSATTKAATTKAATTKTARARKTA